MSNDLPKQTNLLKKLVKNPQNAKEQDHLMCNRQI
jgi:hypothetical protein